MTTDHLIETLVVIGQTEEFHRISEICSASPEIRSGQHMRQLPQFWTEHSSALGPAEMVALIKALTIAERDLPNWGAGSVSPVIWLYRDLRNRFPDDYTKLEDWILRHTENDYLPWGRSNRGAKSVDEYRRLSASVAQRREDRLLQEQDRQSQARERKAREATQKLFGAVRRGDVKAITSLRRQGADIHAANDTGLSPIALAREHPDRAVLEALTCELSNEP